MASKLNECSDWPSQQQVPQGAAEIEDARATCPLRVLGLGLGHFHASISKLSYGKTSSRFKISNVERRHAMEILVTYQVVLVTV